MIAGLRKIDADLAWAVVRIFEGETRRAPAAPADRTVVRLVRVAERRSLIVVSRAEFTRLPGVMMIPVSASRAFLALEPGLGMSDLELAVTDRLDEETIDERERKALTRLRAQLPAVAPRIARCAFTPARSSRSSSSTARAAAPRTAADYWIEIDYLFCEIDLKRGPHVG